jgi:hypothetical protein
MSVCSISISGVDPFVPGGDSHVAQAIPLSALFSRPALGLPGLRFHGKRQGCLPRSPAIHGLGGMPEASDSRPGGHLSRATGNPELQPRGNCRT